MAGGNVGPKLEYQPGVLIAYKVAASTHIYKHSFVAVNATGYLVSCGTATANIKQFVGVAQEEKDNSAGGDGAMSCVVKRDYAYKATTSGATQANVGDVVYANAAQTSSVDQTVALTTGGLTALVPMGICIKVDSATVIWFDSQLAPAIDVSELGTLALTSAHLFVGSAGGIATDRAITGDVTINNTGVTAIASGAIVNADVNAAAAIDYSKLAALASANILVGSAGNVATVTAVTGDIAITNAGLTSIASGVIVNADVKSDAAIDFSKLASLTNTHVLVGNGAGVATDVAISGDATLANTGALTIANGAVNTAKLAGSAVTGAKMVTTGFKCGSMHGAAAPGACTLTGAAVGDRVLFIMQTDDASADTLDPNSFETTVSVINQIQQLDGSDLHLNTYAVVLCAASA